MNESKATPQIIAAGLVFLFIAVALYIRVYFPYDIVFGGDWIKFTSIDSYYHMRLVDNLVHNFPHFTTFDPYLIYPGGEGITSNYFFDWFLACIIWVIGLGSPTERLVNVVGVYFPAVLAALTVIPVYFIGKELIGRWTGVIAAGLMAVLSGEFLGRSILGFADHHVAETLLATVAMLFLILAVKTARQRQLTFSRIMQRDWAGITRPVIYSLLSGFFLGLYLFNWAGGLLFIFILAIYFILQFVIDHLEDKSSDYLCLVGVSLFFITAILTQLFLGDRLRVVPVVIGLVIVAVASGVSSLMARGKMKPVYYPLALVVLGLFGVGIFYLIDPSLLTRMLNAFAIFAPTGAGATTTLEMQPFLFPQGSFSTMVAWGNFTTSFFLVPWWPVPGFALISLSILIYLYTRQSGDKRSYQRDILWTLAILVVIMVLIVLMSNQGLRYFALIPLAGLIGLFVKRRGDNSHWLIFIIWTLVMLLLTLVQRRFAYYLVVNIALLSAYLSWQVIWYVGLRKLVTTTGQIKEKADGRARLKKSERRKASRGITMYHINALLGIIVVFVFVFLFNIVNAKEVAESARFAPSDAWQTSLSWMRENTPEPLGNPDSYYQLETSDQYRSLSWMHDYIPNPSGNAEVYSQHEGSYPYPESAYGVMSWWDYGYWITRIAHRIPNANPGQDPRALSSVASFFTSRDEIAADKIAQELGSSYIVIDHATATSKFWAVITWAGREQGEFVGVYYLPHEGDLLPVQVFYPEYYRTMLVRLYNFDGKAVTEETPMVLSYTEEVSREGNIYRQITDYDEFSSYQEALEYVESQGSSNHVVVGINPFLSPMPLEAVQSCELVYSSESGVSQRDVGVIPEVKIFKYNGD